MSKFQPVFNALPLIGALLLAACGGGGTAAPAAPQTAGGSPGIAVGEPHPGAPARDEFVALAKEGQCADLRNRLYVIDGKQVLWDRAGSCADNTEGLTLYGLTPGQLLCASSDTIAGPRTSCTDESFRSMFDTISKHREEADLGLGASHQVEVLSFLPKPGPVPFESLLQDDYSGVTLKQNVVIRDAASFERLWNAHFLGRSPAEPLPKIDFARKMVVGVFTGAQPTGCRSVAITKAAVEGRQMTVEYEISTLMTIAICTQANTAPMSLAVVDRSDGAVEFVSITPEHLPFSSLDLDNNSGITKAQTAIVKDAATWSALWAQHKRNAVPALPEPVVDFNKFMVVAVFAGSKPNGCYSTTLSNLYRSGRVINVTRIDRLPAPGAVCTQQITSPAHLIMIERSDDPVEVAVRTVS
ncbi:protease complex subunit PrcB family protein [Massilia endophytica]|uniref:protease complex subunit PrcB family protein n=1 Tax=Massilia endophytica TaxID=2899220 RepID=UPI001E2FAEDD|nr:protease complex subunit PrcB family protein [Massilia endophytica]UGQ46497.1 protease complex subunit PrcB family protein [Massilia endophytica]